MCNILQRSSPWCATYCGDYLCSVHHTVEMISVHTTETISAVNNILYFRDHLRGVQHPSEINCIPWSQYQNLHLAIVAFKVTIRRYPSRGTHINHERKDLKNFFLFSKNFFFISVLCCTPWRRLCDRTSRRNRNQIRIVTHSL